jgi:DNA invertase Pin-like site-specific DNA recombinase
MNTNTMIVVGYARVSTSGQALDGCSLDAQREKIVQWADFHGATLDATYADEGISGSRSDNRPALQDALARVDAIRKSGQQAVLTVYSLSRLARSTRDTLSIAERLERAGADLASISERIDTTGATGRMVFRLLAVLAEFERDQIAERTTVALRHKRLAGQKTGGHCPVGYKVDRPEDGPAMLVPDDDGQAIIARIIAEREAGSSYGKIADGLNRDGVAGRAGGRWTGATVRRVAIREAPIETTPAPRA